MAGGTYSDELIPVYRFDPGAVSTLRSALRDPNVREAESQLAPIMATSTDPAGAIAGAELVIICVPAFGHDPLAELLAPCWQQGQTVLWVGEPGGAFAAVTALRQIGRRLDITLGDTNTLPYYGALVSGPGKVGAIRKSGGTLVSALPSGRIDDVASLATAIWPWVTQAESVWETLLLASSLGRELGLATPVIDSLIVLSSVASQRDYASQGKTLAGWGLEGIGVVGLRAAAEQGWW